MWSSLRIFKSCRLQLLSNTVLPWRTSSHSYSPTCLFHCSLSIVICQSDFLIINKDVLLQRTERHGLKRPYGCKSRVSSGLLEWKEFSAIRLSDVVLYTASCLTTEWLTLQQEQVLQSAVSWLQQELEIVSQMVRGA
jgi:hypothetical protein